MFLWALLLAFAVRALASHEARKVGGSYVPIEDVPYTVAIILAGDNTLQCNGALLTVLAVVTAAQCTNGRAPKDLKVRAGSSVWNKGGELIQVQTIEQYPGYNNVVKNDIAILRMETPFLFSSQVMPISLPGPNQLFSAGTQVTISGWGSTSEASIKPDLHISALNVSVISQDYCRHAYSDFHNVTEAMICSEDGRGGRGPCHGDTGRPVAWGNTLVGLHSWSKGCALPHKPNVATRVSHFFNWIKENV